jgi:DNA repair protein RadD
MSAPFGSTIMWRARSRPLDTAAAEQEISVPLEPRHYQRAAIDAVYGWMEQRGDNPLVILPTGTGKSLVIAVFCQEVLQEPGTRILILTHQKELIEQNYLELKDLWPEAPAGIYSAGLNRRDLTSPIIFGGIQSIHRHAYTLQRIDLVLVDEAHLIPRTSNTQYRRFLDALRLINPYLKVIGLTATPFRMDSGRLDRGEDRMFGGICYEYPLIEAIREGYLTRPTSQSAKRQIDTTGVRTQGGEFVASQLEAAAIHPDVVRAVCAEIIENGQDRRGWIVFSCGVEHGRLLTEELAAQGVTVGFIHNGTPRAERDRLIRDFKALKVRCLVSMNVLTTGFNAKHVDLVAIARPTKSTGLYIQIVGRGMRLWPGKEDCLVLDFGGNIDRHGPIDAPKVKGEKKGGGEREAMPEKRCLACESPNPISARQCVECGAEFPPIVQAISTAASTTGLLTEDQLRPKGIPVTSVHYRKHHKPGKTPSMCVTYLCGLHQHKEWVALEHGGRPRLEAVSWWRKRAGMEAEVPNTVDEALERVRHLREPREILVRPNGKFTEIVGATF